MHDFNSLRSKFNALANVRPIIGDPVCPLNIREAKRILEKNKNKSSIEVFSDF